MKKWLLLICIALLLSGCGAAGDPQVDAVRMQVEQLPAMGELARMDEGQQLQVYEQLHTLYGEYMALTPLQRMGIPEAKDALEDRFQWFRERMPAALAEAVPTEAIPETVPETVPETAPETIPETMPETIPETAPETIPETVPETTVREVVVELTEEEQDLLLRLAMAERGDAQCPQCLALIMRTVLNRVENGSFGSSVRKVIYAQEQFGPAMDGSLETAEPNDACREALDMVIHGWDESGGALFYEWVEGETWHSRSLKLAAEHCDGQFYKR